jgi:membrane-bound lytic murein transglycosylase MltF
LDNVYCYEITSLRSQKLLPVVNIALNLVNSENLAWQQRKAESLTLRARSEKGVDSPL